MQIVVPQAYKNTFTGISQVKVRCVTRQHHCQFDLAAVHLSEKSKHTRSNQKPLPGRYHREQFNFNSIISPAYPRALSLITHNRKSIAMAEAKSPEKMLATKPPVYHQNSHSPNATLQLPSPIITRRTRTASTSARAMENPVVSGVVKSFSRTKGHGFITPHGGGEDVFCHVSDIEGEYVPMPGDEVKYRLCAIPPKFEKHQAVHVQISNLTPEVHHKWEEPVFCGSPAK